ncbi:uncharacterized protein MONOS_2877 [Monocercomonoides exilis]|uniref:uncharacterized protein n=1 Tax=Monocercomonoides exilis TaxID=2049356 RepID=UPI003559EF0B|nr:hypothetical protein MONOS_2877 [Monocercomonoides exilis]|eukprot:MONOS_2877.1-p1 / transcript=MONOS_2877.1 / gene=MONOS_2877 / organism=Monocercomonoides_exilis_PA203 / gene_product=unspecified product / transcript_product=unspecified product / location=Mono_scaffold00062:126598-127173(-) / protein_length=192 / sequence_SO=supercontig / SO=protein_coding / is_pseudo=false
MGMHSHLPLQRSACSSFSFSTNSASNGSCTTSGSESIAESATSYAHVTHPYNTASRTTTYPHSVCNARGMCSACTAAASRCSPSLLQMCMKQPPQKHPKGQSQELMMKMKMKMADHPPPPSSLCFSASGMGKLIKNTKDAEQRDNCQAAPATRSFFRYSTASADNSARDKAQQHTDHESKSTAKDRHHQAI